MTEPTPVSRTARRAAARRRRRITIGALVAVVALLVVVAGAVVLSSGGGGDDAPVKVAQAAPATTTTTIPPTTTTTVPPPAAVATTKVASLQVFDAPNGAPTTSLSAKTEYLQPRTLLVTERQGEWLKALLPMRPNQSEGWIRESDVTLSGNPYMITINLANHELVFLKDGQEILRSSIVGGAPRTPTPLGKYYITDPVDLRASPGGAYGAYALGISGYSEVLFEFNGGPGQIAIHGTNQPELVGQDVSNGCIRVPNEVILEIAKQAPLGTPVLIS